MPMSHTMLVPRQSFSPLKVPGLGLWLDASDSSTLTMNSSTVAEIRDKSGNLRHYTQGAALSQPSLAEINGRSALQGVSPTTSLLGNAASLTLTRNVPGVTMISVMRFGNLANQAPFWFAIGTNVSGRAQITRIDGSGGIFAGGRRLDSDSLQVAAYTANETPHVFSGCLDYENSDAFIWEDGSLKSSNLSFQTAGNSSDTSSNSSTLLAAVPGTFHFNGELGCLLVWPRALTTAERQYIERGLGRQWGLAVA